MITRSGGAPAEMADGEGRPRLFSLQASNPPPVPLAEPGAPSASSRRSTISYVAGRLPKQLAKGQSLLRDNSPILRPKLIRRDKTAKEGAVSEGELQSQWFSLRACLHICAYSHNWRPRSPVQCIRTELFSVKATLSVILSRCLCDNMYCACVRV